MGWSDPLQGTAMPEVKEKKVDLIELFYDLIYVYAISQMTLIVATEALVVFGFMDRPYVPLRFSDSYRR